MSGHRRQRRYQISHGRLISDIALVLGLLLLPASAEAATKYWIGAAGGSFNSDANWSQSSGGANNTTHPISTDLAVFDSAGNTNCLMDSAVSVQGIDIQANYTQTITQNAGVTLTIGSLGYAQADGIFTGGDSAIDINDKGFTLSGGAFTNSSGNMTVERNFTVSGGTFTNTSKTVTFDSTDAFDDSTLTCTGSLGGTVAFNKTTTGADLTVASGCSIALGAGPTSTLGIASSSTGLTNNGTITIASGTWTVNAS
ncbi:MAG: hypothetical protein HY737_00515, partial [Candidatus Omnitrophica bacterium]|nr:hypothetical protein [Candidatus Omnitrophota bacterium]